MIPQPRFDVLAMGELNADLIITGLREAPALNREIIAGSFRKTLGSSTALCAANIAKMGLKVGFCGKVGNDEDGHFVLRELQARHVDTSFCKIDPFSETGITLGLNWGGDRALVTVLGATSTFSAADFDPTVLKTAGHIHVGSFFLQAALRRDLPGIFKTARGLGLTTSLDAGWDDTGTWDFGIRDLLPHTDVFFPSETEALNVTGKSSAEEAAAELAGLCRIAVIKRGSLGAYCVSNGRVWQTASYDDVPVVDTTGAGDSFNAGFIYGFVRGLPPERCLEYGNACGNICVGVTGGANADLGIDNVEAIMRAHGRL
ncbi:MAG: carbohydrate kinase family protein [Treponema sp.]|jgi:sugar/nucleoside kinase (ribokinase family)|nr:carbohydrate kinase family protein [Treponema sp.]